MTAGGARLPKTCVRRRRAGHASDTFRKTRGVPWRTGSSALAARSWRGPDLLRGRLSDPDQLHVEHQHADRLSGLAFVREVLRDPEARLLSFDHQLHTFGPS